MSGLRRTTSPSRVSSCLNTALTAGKAMALRRPGVDEGTVEFFMHVDRGNTNWVRTGWEALRAAKGRSRPCFEAMRGGVAQGSAESPLLWIVFFDTILSRLRLEGVGASTKTSSADGNLTGHGLVVFAPTTRRFSKPPLSLLSG